jgi:hypothetical protein
MANQHSALDEGTDVGLLGGVSVALFFLVVDLLAGAPGRTPSVLGQTLLFGRAEPDIATIDFGAALLYTVAHFAAFAVIGILLTQLVHTAVHNPLVRFAILPAFVVFELFFYGVLAMFSERTAELFPVWRVVAANTLAAVVMGWWLWKRHPALRRVLLETPLGDAEDVGD